MNDIVKVTVDEIKIIECNSENVNSNIKSIFNILKYKFKMKNFKNKITCKLVFNNLIKQEKFEQIYYMFNDEYEYDYSTKVIACAKTAFENEEKIILKEWI